MVAFFVDMAIIDLARFSVVNSVTVAQVQAVRGAKAPDCVLHEPWECRGEISIKGAGINAAGNGSDDLGAATRGVTGGAVGVGDTAVLQNAGTVQEIMHQGVNCDHG